MADSDLEVSLNQHLVVFKDKNIRRTWYKEGWWFSVIDVVQVLTNSTVPRRYWSDLKIKLKNQGFSELYDRIVQLKIEASDGKKYATDCANVETLFRIIQTIPSSKAEPFKRWLAKVGFERVQEIDDPELATKRARALYEAKGYSKDWIEKRMRGVAIREDLTTEWKHRGIEENKEFAILTAEISQATFGMTPAEYKKHKGLKRENLRDHMTDLELIFSMLGEASTTEITRNRNAQGFDENKIAAQEGGVIAGNARKALENKSKKKIISNKNFILKSVIKP